MDYQTQQQLIDYEIANINLQQEIKRLEGTIEGLRHQNGQMELKLANIKAAYLALKQKYEEQFRDGLY